METLKKLLEVILEFFQAKKQDKIEKEETKRVQTEQKEKVSSRLEVLKKREIKQPKKEDFFNDEDW